jgi:transposase
MLHNRRSVICRAFFANLIIAISVLILNGNTAVAQVAGTGTKLIPIGPAFAGFCEYFLAPTLHPGDLVLLDNLSSHKSTAAVAAIEAVGAKMVYLPPYSPDLNPIENVFSKIKQLIRGLRPGNWHQIVQSAKQALLQLTCDDIENAFMHCGYQAT